MNKGVSSFIQVKGGSRSNFKGGWKLYRYSQLTQVSHLPVSLKKTQTILKKKIALFFVSEYLV